MQLLSAISVELGLKESLSSIFYSYIGVTEKFQDKVLVQSLITATENPPQQNSRTVYNDFDIAFAVGLTFKLIVEQDIELFEYIDNLCKHQANKYQNYAIELLKYTIFQLDKREPVTYLKNIFANKYVPLQPLDEIGINFSKFYTFVHLCELGPLFKQFQGQFKYKFWNYEDDQSVNSVELQDAQLFFFQTAPSFPILVLIKENFDEIQRKVALHHSIFIKDISVQFIIDSLDENIPISQTIQNLKGQPFRFNDEFELMLTIFAGQPNVDEKVRKFLRKSKIHKNLRFLLIPAQINYIQEIKKDQEEDDIFQFNTAEKVFDPFKNLNPKQELRRYA